MKEQKGYFSSTGSYGCVHYPRIKCNGTQKTISKKDGLLSKLTKYDYYAKNEIEVGQKLKRLETLKNNPIVFVEHKCDIKKKGVNKIMKKYKNCEKSLLRNSDKENDYVLLFSKYYKSITVDDYFNDNFSINKVLKYFYFSVYVSNIIKVFNIVHNDMHFKNVIYDKDGHFHLIDFGLCLDIDKLYLHQHTKLLNYRHLSKVLVHIDIERTSIPIEYHFLTHYVFNRRVINKIEMMNMINNYYTNLGKKKWFSYFGDLDKYKNMVFEYYSDIFVNNESIEKHIVFIVTKASSTWDMYRVSSLTLNVIDRLKDEIKPSSINMDKFLSVLYQCMHFDYTQRPSSETLLKVIFSLSLI